jgi:hypothetical protein
MVGYKDEIVENYYRNNKKIVIRSIWEDFWGDLDEKDI